MLVFSEWILNLNTVYSAVLCVYTTVILYCLYKYIYAWHRIILCINHKSLWYNNKSWTIIKLRIRETSSWLYKDPCQLVTSFHRVWLFLDIIPLDETICSKQELKRYICALSLFICGSHFRVWSITFKNISEELNGHNSCSWPNGATTLIRRYLTKVRIPLSKKPFLKVKCSETNGIWQEYGTFGKLNLIFQIWSSNGPKACLRTAYQFCSQF